jgi:uncharacterized repeat protein (TIGR03803 family)
VNSPICSRAPLTLLVTLAVLVPATAEANREKVLYSFAGGRDGAFTQAGVIVDAHGNFYGTTQEGGSTGCGGGGCGTVFKLTPRGNETVLHVFTAGTDGAYPVLGLVADSAGNLYGTTLNGGGNCQCGTVFKVKPDGKESVLYDFAGGSDGAFPVAGLIADGAGNFYGTTGGGGIDCNGTGEGCGTVFRITPRGRENVLYAFKGGNDGIYPAAGLLPGSPGIFYGTTANGGTDCDGTGQGCGTIFELTVKGAETVLYAFKGGNHGAYPAAGVIEDGAGNFYGTTNNGGVDCDGSGAGCGAVFELAANGKETGLHVFMGGSDGAYPKDAPVMDSAGNLYGTTVEGGGANDGGVVFRVKPGGRETIIYSFSGGADGGGPFAGLIMDASGNLYGTTYVGGADGDGTVFKLMNPTR